MAKQGLSEVGDGSKQGRWKLLTSCGVHVIILSTVQLFLLVERRYPLSKFTLEQLVNVARLQVKEESRTSKSLTLEIHHGGWFTQTPSRSYIGGHVSSVNVVDIDEFCLYDLNNMVVKLGYGVEDLMCYHFLIPSLNLDYGLRSLNVDVDVLEMAKQVDNHLRMAPIDIDSSLDAIRNLTPMCHRILKKEQEQVSSKSLSIECAEDPFEELDDILGEYAHIGKQITKNKSTWNEITRKQMVVHVDDDLDVIDYDSLGSDLDDGIDFEKRMQLRELRRIGKQKNKGPNKYYFYLGQQFASKEIVKGIVKKHSVETRRQLILVKNDNERVSVRCEGTIPALVPYVAIDNNTDKNVFSQTKGGPAIRENIDSGKHNILDHVIKSLATNPNILMRAFQDQMQKQFEVGVSKMKAFWAKRIASYIMTGSYREQYSLLREYAQELINQNPGTTVRIDVQQEPKLESLTRTFKIVYVCLGALKQGFRACGREILVLDGCFMSGLCPCQILTTVEVDANNGIYPVAYAIVEAERGVYKEMLWNAAKATSEGEFKKKMGKANCDLLIHNICEVFNRQLETWAHVYSFKVDPYNGMDMWPIVESKTVVIPPLYKPPIGRPPMKRKKSNDEIASQSASSGKLSRKGKSVSCGKYGNVGHNRKGCKGQGGGSSQGGARKVSGQAAGAKNVSGQAVGARKVSGEAPGATNVSGQAADAMKVSG
nr:hypothetical protein [Tanacetum cinerariifolium]